MPAPAWNERDHAALITRMHDELPGQIRAIAWTATEVLDTSADLPVDSIASEAETLLPAVADLTAQRDQLVYDGFIAAVGADRLTDIARYLEASHFRLERLADTAAKDRDRMRSVQVLEAEHAALMDERGPTVDLEELAGSSGTASQSVRSVGRRAAAGQREADPQRLEAIRRS